MRSANDFKLKHVRIVIFSTTLLLHHLVCPVQGIDTFFPFGVNNNTGLVADSSEIDLRLKKTKEKLENSDIVQRKRSSSNELTPPLVLLQVLHRHGDRSPVHTYPNYHHKDAWPQGLGQLSKIGMYQSYELGEFLQNSYSSFLGSDLPASQVYIRSTDYDRTLMTAECVAAGLFNKTTIFQSTLLDKWHPVPINSVPLTTDKLLRPSYACQYIKDLRANITAVHASQKKTIFDKEYMLRLSRLTGMEINATSLLDLADVVFSEKQHGLQSPEWLTKEMEDELIAYSMEKEFVTPDVAKYLMGTLFDTLMRNMKSKITNPSDPVKLNLFSAHESTVRFLKALLGVDNQKEVPYIGAIIIELYYLHDEHYIRFLYRNSSNHTHQLQRLPVNHCNNFELCRFSDFQKGYKDLMFSDEEWDEICQADPSRIFSIKQNLVPILVAVLVLCLALLMFLGYKLYVSIHQMRHRLTLDQYALLKTDGDAEDSDKEEFAMDDFNHLVGNHKSEEEPKDSQSARENQDG